MGAHVYTYLSHQLICRDVPPYLLPEDGLKSTGRTLASSRPLGSGERSALKRYLHDSDLAVFFEVPRAHLHVSVLPDIDIP